MAASKRQTPLSRSLRRILRPRRKRKTARFFFHSFLSAAMRIALDTNPLYTTRAGMARYVRSLLDAFHRYCALELEIVEVGWPVGNFGFQQPQRALKTAYRELV